ncbi:MAG: hypothetical protein M0Z62_08920 [Actinomycetota bacterium]|nr:hypothetical protein [Actinomycetota bacterium]
MLDMLSGIHPRCRGGDGDLAWQFPDCRIPWASPIVQPEFALARDTGDALAFIVALALPAAATIAVLFRQERRFADRIAERDRSGVDPRVRSLAMSLGVDPIAGFQMGVEVMNLRCLTVHVQDGEFLEARGRSRSTFRSWGQFVELTMMETLNGCKAQFRTWPTEDRSPTDMGAGTKLLAAIATDLAQRASELGVRAEAV